MKKECAAAGAELAADLAREATAVKGEALAFAAEERAKLHAAAAAEAAAVIALAADGRAEAKVGPKRTESSTSRER